MTTARWILASALGAAVPAASGAQELMDPTKPPSVMRQQQDDAAAPAGGSAGRLQSILLSRARKIAIIDGEAVPIGGKVGAATLVGISESEVVLREGTETRVLRLHPGVDRKVKR